MLTFSCPSAGRLDDGSVVLALLVAHPRHHRRDQLGLQALEQLWKRMEGKEGQVKKMTVLYNQTFQEY